MTVDPRELRWVARAWNDAVIALTTDRKNVVAEYVSLCVSHSVSLYQHLIDS